jgi:hypothetical protein
MACALSTLLSTVHPNAATEPGISSFAPPSHSLNNIEFPALHPTPCTLHPAPCTLHPVPSPTPDPLVLDPLFAFCHWTCFCWLIVTLVTSCSTWLTPCFCRLIVWLRGQMGIENVSYTPLMPLSDPLSDILEQSKEIESWIEEGMTKEDRGDMPNLHQRPNLSTPKASLTVSSLLPSAHPYLAGHI